ncbi:MAG: dockerin type I domain-containing protein [Phycisphaerales bacterium]|nr:dockerin type I domain-containing protein [Phycisphaerales bacterium]MCI0675082.1 dockerin type I domain-containing protein [Phycisphaerales bacterium]
MTANNWNAYALKSIVVQRPPVGDINGDGAVNIVDLLALIGSWGSCPPKCAADLNADGIVNVADLLMLIGNWG